MKKIISILSILFLSASLMAGKVNAEDEPIASESAAIVIEEEDIPSLVVEPGASPSAELIIPPPAPTPPDENLGDNRSWTKFAYKKIIASVSQKYNVDPQVIYATIMTESEGNKYAFRYEPGIKDASLCMGQILINTARSLGFTGEPKEMYKPEVCIDLIGRYHRSMLNDYGDLTPEQLARAYNSGSPYKRAVPGHIWRFDMWYYEEG